MTSAKPAASQGRSVESDSLATPDPLETQVGTWHWNFGTRLLTIDRAWCASLGLNPCEGPQHLDDWARQIHPDDLGEFQRKRDAVKLGRLDRFEVEYRV